MLSRICGHSSGWKISGNGLGSEVCSVAILSAFSEMTVERFDEAKFRWISKDYCRGDARREIHLSVGRGKSGKAYENRKHYSQIPENDDQETEKDGCEGPKEKSQAAGSPRSAERLPNQSSGLSICVRRP